MPGGQADHLPGRAGQPDAEPLGVPTARAVRQDDLRPGAAPRRDWPTTCASSTRCTGKTNTHGPGENFMSHRLHARRLPERRRLGRPTRSAARTRTCPPTSPSPTRAACRSRASTTGGPASCPAAFQGTDFNAAKPVRNLAIPNRDQPRAPTPPRAPSRSDMNERHLEQHPGDTELAARIASYELAATHAAQRPRGHRPLQRAGTHPARSTAPTTRQHAPKTCARLRAQLHPRAPPDRERRALRAALQRRLPTSGEGVSNWDGHKDLKEQYDVHGPDPRPADRRAAHAT